MKVTLAGYNVDKKILEKLPEEIIATPETISAAYARVSRDPRDIPDLRQEAREQVKKARRSNQAIVFGMSHHSVAEHAYFNFDILHISRLALEELEARRIGAAYTEKSQRYITLRGDFVIPAEFSENDAKQFEELIGCQNAFYLRNLEKLERYQYEVHPELVKQAEEAACKGVSDKMNRTKNTLEGWAKEDARYALSLATQAQLGLSFNARTLEHAIRTLRNSNLAECRELARKLFDVTKEIAPSLIILADPHEFKKAFQTDLKDDNYQFTNKHLKQLVKDLIDNFYSRLQEEIPRFWEAEHEKLILESNIDRNIAAAIIHHNSLLTIEDSYRIACLVLSQESSGKDFFGKVMKYVSAFDSLPREFEFTGELKYELVVSASNFAQLKRHRLMTILAQAYDPGLGITVPDSVKEIGAEEELLDVCRRSEELYFDFLPKYGKAAEYCLTNAHRRRALVSANPRELYHFSRLREDEHAQWDIKATAGRMLKLAKQVAPHTFLLSGGKDQYTRS